MKTTKTLIELLEAADYPLRFIARQANVPYMKLYRYKRSEYTLTPDEEARIRRFAIVQPCIMDGTGDDN